MINLKKILIMMVFAAIMLLNFVMPINRLNPNAFGSSALVAVPSYILSNTASQDPLGVIILQVGSSTFTINGESKTFDTPPIIKNGRTLLPIRAIIESLKGSISWSPTEKKVTINFGNNNIELWIAKPIAKVNGKDIPIDSSNPNVVPEIIDGRTMLPVRFITENLEFDVKWDANLKTVTITYGILIITLQTSESCTISLVENPTTGFAWHWEIKDPTVISIESEKTIPLNNLIGAPRLHLWVIKGLKSGTTLITFKYFRNFEPEKIEETIIYEVTVK